MIASRRSSRVAAIALLGGCTALAGLAACRTPSAPPAGPAVDRDVRFSSVVPDVADHAAADLAAAALSSQREEAARALSRLEAIDTVLTAAGEKPTGLLPVSHDLVNATLDDPRAYREAARELLRRDDLEPALRARLDRAQRDDLLHLADARVRDARLLAFGRAFNAVAEPIGRSIMTTAMAPYRISRSVVNYLIQLYSEEALPLQRRQALDHWQDFLARYPDAPEAEELLPRVQQARARLNQTYRDRAVHIAERALDRGQARLALVYADRAARHVPEDRRASQLRDEAAELLLKERRDRRNSVSAAGGGPPPVVPDGARPLALALLDPEGDVEGAARDLLESDPEGPLGDEALFALALARGEAGEESAMWEDLEEIADRDTAESNMARHARALLESPDANPYGAFTRAKRSNRVSRLLWVLAGPWFRGPPQHGLPRSLEWAVHLPSMAESAAATPMRLIQLPWAPSLPSARVTAACARRYLARHPQGEYAEQVRDWLEPFERKRENWLGALHVAKHRQRGDLETLAELREKAAHQSLEIALREKRRDVRNTMYRQVAREFQGTRAGRRAGALARAEVENSTPQRIRISRGFLLENPRVAGPHGLGLRPGLLDDDPANGEIHPEGVALVGGRVIELSYLGPSGDQDDPPTRVQETISEKRLARLVSTLEEASFRNSLVDPDDELGADAQRDMFFERARLGLADDVDPRAAAESVYAYRGMQERYGMVRAREPILPFDLVIQGSLTELSFGAFPRIRPPRQTPDAFLYK